MEKFYDTSFSSQADGSIRLIQSDCGEDYIIDLHPEQLLFIARRLCGMKPETAGKVAELERRLSVLTDKLQNIVCNGTFRTALIERLGDGSEYLAKLDGLLDLAIEFDGGRLEPDENTEPSPNPSATLSKPNANPNETQSVTNDSQRESVSNQMTLIE